MRAGLLIFDHVKPAYQEKYGDYPDMFVQLFPELEWTFYEVLDGILPVTIEECEVYFGTGSRHSVYEPLAWIDEAKAFLKRLNKYKKKYVGFCFGHQLLAAALGGRVEKATQGWCVGVHTLELISGQEQAWMHPQSETLNLLMMCQDQVITLPPNAICLASAELCPIGMFQLGDHMLGIQAHPEFSKAYDQVLMESRIEIMGQKVVETGVKSLNLSVDRSLIQQWILNFLR